MLHGRATRCLSGQYRRIRIEAGVTTECARRQRRADNQCYIGTLLIKHPVGDKQLRDVCDIIDSRPLNNNAWILRPLVSGIPLSGEGE